MAVYDRDGNVIIRPIEKTPKKKGGNGPRKSGDRVERIIAKEIGEKRTPMSGAVKFSNKNLTGDIDVHDEQNQPFIKLEVKYTGKITPKGEKSYTLTTGVLNQVDREALEAGELGALIIQFKGGKRYAVINFENFHELIALARLGRTVLKGK